jgi:16S rRNA (guanine527-N7)-methyltransferase
VGTGGGLPGIPLAVFLTSSNIILLDSRIKICIFLNQVVAELKLKNAVIVNGRAELLSHESGFRENFDLVVSRALGNVRQVSEITVPFCKTGGRIILYKSKKVHEEINEAKEALNILSAETEEIFETDVPDLNKYRVLLVIKKLKSTLYKYPRKYAKMLKKPLP